MFSRRKRGCVVLKSLYAKQVALLVSYSAATLGLSFWLDYQPRLRMGLSSFLSAAGAALLVWLVAAIWMAVHRKLRREKPLLPIEFSPAKLSTIEGWGHILVAAAGEEVLLRGLVFSFLWYQIPWVSFFVNAGLSYLIAYMLGASAYLRLGQRKEGEPKREQTKTPLFAVVEGTFFALLYTVCPSVFAVFCARALSEIAALMLVQGQRKRNSKLRWV